MSSEGNMRAKKANDSVGLSLVVLFLLWLPIYLLGVRPLLNAWLAEYISSYPALLHVIPIFTPIVFLGWILAKKYLAPLQPDQAEDVSL